jgi:tetratricopeptide (TPR) repeat protein
VFLINAESQSSFELDYLKISVSNTASYSPTKENIYYSLISSNSEEWLIIVDNANDESVLFGQSNLFQYIPTSTNGCVIFITRDSSMALQLAGTGNVEHLKAFSESDAEKLLLSRMDDSYFEEDDGANARTLLELLDYHPLLICHAASFITANPISIAEYLRVYVKDETSMTEHLSEVLDPDQPRAFGSNDERISASWLFTFLNAFEKIRRDSPQAAHVLCFMACLSNRRLPKALLPSENPPISQADLSKALNILKAHCLIVGDRNDEEFSMPRAVSLAIRRWLTENKSLDFWVDKAFTSVYETFPEPKLDKVTFTMYDIYLDHAEVVLNYKQPGSDKLPERATLATRCSMYLQMRGQYDRAEAHAKKAAEWSARGLGENNEKTLDLRGNWAKMLRYQGRFKEALRIDKGVLEHRSRVQGDTHSATLKTMESVGSALHGMGRYKEAVRMHNKVFRVRKATMGPKNGATLASRTNLCRCLISMKKYNAAEEIERKVLSLKIDLLGAEHESTLNSKEVLGVVLRHKGDFIHAEQCFRQVLKGRIRWYGKDTAPSVLAAQSNIAMILADQGRLQEALPLAREVHAQSIKVRGHKHPDTIKSAHNLSEILVQLKDFEPAEYLKRQVLEARQKILGPYHPDTEHTEESLRQLHEIKECRDLQDVQIPWDGFRDNTQLSGTENCSAGHITAGGETQLGVEEEERVLFSRHMETDDSLEPKVESGSLRSEVLILTFPLALHSPPTRQAKLDMLPSP